MSVVERIKRVLYGVPQPPRPEPRTHVEVLSQITLLNGKRHIITWQQAQAIMENISKPEGAKILEIAEYIPVSYVDRWHDPRNKKFVGMWLHKYSDNLVLASVRTVAVRGVEVPVIENLKEAWYDR